MTGIGVDLADIRRVQRYVDASPSFLAMSWTDREQEQCAGRADRLASRWAAKEAVMKALGTGLGRTSPDDIEIVTDDTGCPAVHLLGDTAAMFAGTDVQVSMTHEGPWAMAVAIATPS
ncbi:MAG TPA: holo-ACP synthase [Frankiaceae bacterium]|nr:holo-ACP synthase [Frankiaceae bacterium]